MLSRALLAILLHLFLLTGFAFAGELGVIPRPLFEALNALRASNTVPAAVVNEELRRLGAAYRELTGLGGSVELAPGLKATMARLGTRYGELLEEQAGLVQKLRAAGDSGSGPYRDGAGGDEARLERVNGELRMTLEKALLVPFVLRPENISITQLEARSRSERVSVLTLVGSLFSTGVAAGLTDVYGIGHGSVALQTWAVATSVFFGLAALKPGSLRSWLMVKPALRAMEKTFYNERDALFATFTESASASSEKARAASLEVGAGFDFVTHGLGQASQTAALELSAVRTRVCEYGTLTPEQRVRVGTEAGVELESDQVAEPARKRRR